MRFIVATNGDNAPEILPFDIIYFDEYTEDDVDAGDVIVYLDATDTERISRIKSKTAEGLLLKLDNGETCGVSDVCGTVVEVRRMYGVISYIQTAAAQWINGYCERHKDKNVTFDEAFVSLRGMLGALTEE